VICPKNQTVVIALAQFLPLKPQLTETFKKGVDDAIEAKDVAKKGSPAKRQPKAFRLRTGVGVGQ
jgi:hypothetical protein